MVTETDELLTRYESRLASSGKMRNHYLRFAREYLDFVRGDFSRQGILDYLDYLRSNRGYNDGSIRFAFSIIRTLFNRNNLEWPFRRGESPQVRENNVNAPALDPDIVIEMIEATKRDNIPEEKFFLALSTTYGLRREELLELTKDDVDLVGKTIHIHTLKHGRERTHIVPDALLPIIADYEFETKSEFKLLELWYRLEYKIGLKHIDGVGFHSIRRTLNTLLLDKLPETVVMSFLRWKQRTSTNMPFRYSAQRFVGKEGITTRVLGEAKDVDNKVFAVHPFIKYW